MDIAKPNLSQHLAILRRNGLVTTRRSGTTIYYRLAHPRITEACTIMRGVLLDALRKQASLSKALDDRKQGK
jgi:ArsR family transcriptional regulator, arsenate/arsenite/antimonite-responsive transcriptional repressor